MRTGRIRLWRTGGALLSIGLACILIAASQWREGALYPLWGTLMLLGLGPAAIGASLIASALHEFILRELLKQRGLRLRMAADFVAKGKRGNGYFIYIRCVLPDTCEEGWLKSPLLLDDPTHYLGNGVEILLDTITNRYYVLAEELGKEIEEP